MVFFGSVEMVEVLEGCEVDVEGKLTIEQLQVAMKRIRTRVEKCGFSIVLDILNYII
jgi:hypothetical protein